MNQTVLGKTLHEYYSRTIREAARVWLRAVLSSDRIPVWSGQALATLRPAARLLRVAMKPIRPFGKVKSRVAAGEAQGFIDLETEYGGRYLFKYTTTVPYFRRNETVYVSNLRNPTPWRATKQGDLAAITFLRERKLDAGTIRIISEHLIFTKKIVK